MFQSVSSWSAGLLVLGLAGAVCAVESGIKKPDVVAHMSATDVSYKYRTAVETRHVIQESATSALKLQKLGKPAAGEHVNRLKVTGAAPQQLKFGSVQGDDARLQKSTIEKGPAVKQALSADIQTLKLRRLD